MLNQVKELIDKKEYLEAIKELEPLMQNNPMDPMGLFLLGQILLATEKQSIAYPIYKLLTQLEPSRPEIWVNMGKAAGELHKYDEEEKCFKKALSLSKKTNNEVIERIAVQNLGTCSIHSCKIDKAIHWAKKSLEFGDVRQSKVDLGFAYLMKRDFKKGWDYYNEGIGFQANREVSQYIDEPEWDGSEGKRLIITGEQGVGDQIMFAGAVRDVRRMSKSVTLHVNPKLVGLFSRSFILPAYGYGPDDDKSWVTPVDASASMSRIQQYFRNDISKFTGKPYLIADPNRRIQWRALLDTLGDKPKIGIAWTGGAQATQASERSTTLENLLPILNKDVTWISLEYKERTEEIQEFTKKHGIKIHDYSWATRTKDYDDTAGLVAELDLVITVPTSAVHLAGGLGVPCWCIVHPHSHWAFGMEGEEMPFYKSVKLYRRKKGWEPLEVIGGKIDEMRSNYPSRAGTRRDIPSSIAFNTDSRISEGTVREDRCISH